MRTVPLAPFANATTGGLQFFARLNETRAARFRVSLTLASAAAGGNDQEAPFVMLVQPAAPQASGSSFAGVSHR